MNVNIYVCVCVCVCVCVHAWVSVWVFNVCIAEQSSELNQILHR